MTWLMMLLMTLSASAARTGVPAPHTPWAPGIEARRGPEPWAVGEERVYDARVVHSNRDRVVELDLSGRLHVLATERSRDGVWFTAWLTDAEVTAAGRTELEPTDQAFAIHVSPSGELQLRAPRHWHPDHGAWLPQQPTELQRAFVTLAHALFPPPPPTRRTRRWMTVRPMPLGTWFADARRNGRTVTVTRGPAPPAGRLSRL